MSISILMKFLKKRNIYEVCSSPSRDKRKEESSSSGKDENDHFLFYWNRVSIFICIYIKYQIYCNQTKYIRNIT